jgi:hypothetical protein
MTKEQLPKIFERLQRYNFPLRLTFQKSKCRLQREDYEQLARLTLLTNLQLPVYSSENESDLLPLTSLTNLESIPSPNFPPEVARYFTKSTNLYLENEVHLEKMGQTRFPNVEAVFWHFSPFQPMTSDPLGKLPHTQHITQLQFRGIPETVLKAKNWMRFPNLKSLLITSSYRCKCIFDLPYLPNLEVLYCEVSNVGSLAAVHETLTSLRISCEKVNGAELAELKNLRSLRMDFTDFQKCPTSMEFLTALTNLESYDFSSQNFNPAWGEELQYIAPEKLTTLKLRCGKYKIDHITKFGNLQSLEVDQIASPTAQVFGQLANLTELLIHTVSKDILPNIEILTNLKSLKLHAVPQLLNPKEFIHIEKLRALEDFSFQNVHLSNNVYIDQNLLVHLPLKKISVNWPVGDKFVENLCAINTLEVIHILNGADVTDGAIAALTRLSNLTRLTINEAGHFTGTTLTLLTNLEVLNVRSFSRLVVNSKKLCDILPRLYDVNIITP